MDIQLPSSRRAKNLWFDDGNIVFLAGDLASFRVYQGILSAISPVFQDMLSVPHPEDAKTVEGCPVVRVSDSAEDFTRFFEWVFHIHRDSFVYGAQPLPFTQLASVLRIAHKYDVADAAAIAVDRLSRRFCAPFDTALSRRVSWDEIEAHLNTTHAAVAFTPSDAFEALNLMRLVNKSAPVKGPNAVRFADRTLAVALFYCCVAAEQNPRLLRTGTPRADGQVEVLSDEDFERCVRGLALLRQESLDVVSRAMVVYGDRYEGFKDIIQCMLPPRVCKDNVRRPTATAQLTEYGKKRAEAQESVRDMWV
ncbi:uncharacterized protein BXZ73DRAFT_44760 [Epithele typhae]|uniref:uncharacterized protein n=1 Tax=Epithele typhae TaxID=378194 RepID=UPI002007D3C4|nr:uncharacterized protein BXZ73DRAFT_44760 [Epithele typhae]KAH9937909.1 hypothetical protein BXZ73DRAFT_44760 [Epithele typhae]